GRENDESAEACALRELYEEFGLSLDSSAIIWTRRYERGAGHDEIGYFLTAPISLDEIGSIVFGSEGQRWEMMPIADFLDHPRAVPHLQERLRGFLREHEIL